MENLAVIYFFSALVGQSLEADITAIRSEMFPSEGGRVTLSCNYSVKAENLQWYRQDPGSAPRFLLLITDTKDPTVVEAEPPNPRLTAGLNKERNRVDLLISSAAVTDSAVYYCAVRPDSGGFKIFFGTGTSLTIETKEEIEPDYYDLGPNGDGTTVCLATGFTRLKATMREPGFQNQSASQITDLKGEPTGFYSQVAFQKDGGKCGDSNKEPVQCDAELEPDEMVNLASITIFGLRIIFIKTVAFNVLMTLRLWISQ